jgi:hypothetical protein
MWWLFLLISIYIHIKMQRKHKWANMESVFVLKSKSIWINFISQNVSLPWIYIFEPINQIKRWDIENFVSYAQNQLEIMLPVKWNIVDNVQEGNTQISNQNFAPSNNLSSFPKIVQKYFHDNSILAFDSSSISHFDFKHSPHKTNNLFRPLSLALTTPWIIISSTSKGSSK